MFVPGLAVFCAVSVGYIHMTTNVFAMHVFPLDYGPSEAAQHAQIAPLCSRVDRNPEKCNEAIFRAMALDNITCPSACVTFDGYGRFNNNIIQLSNEIAKYVDPRLVPSGRRRSILLHSDFRQYVESYFDTAQLEKVCIFPAWYLSRELSKHAICQKISPHAIFSADEPRHHGLRLAWLLVGAIRVEVQEKNAAESAVFGTEYSALHVRSLENRCHLRHWNFFLPSNICDLSAKFVRGALVGLGHLDEPIVICSDMQQNASVQTLARELNATLSPSTDLYFDFMLLLFSKRFVGNIVSSFSVNIARVRHAIFGPHSLDVLK